MNADNEKVRALADKLQDVADDYRFVIPQFHAQNRRKMKAYANTLDEVIAELKSFATPPESAQGVRRGRLGDDGTEQLCQAVYGRKAEARDYVGGSDAQMLYDAAAMILAQRRAASPESGVATEAAPHGHPEPPAAADERQFDQVLRERDHYHDMADQLADQIAAITEQDIGEHSSANCPWHSALLAADEYLAARFKRLCFGEPSSSTAKPAAQELELPKGWCSLGVGSGDTGLFVHGPYEAIKECQRRLAQPVGEVDEAARVINRIADMCEWFRNDGRTHLAIRVADGTDLTCKAARRDALALLAALRTDGGEVEL